MDDTQPTIIINGVPVPFTLGQTILEVARSNGVNIPTLCYLKGCTATGACRVCLVEVKGARTLVASCAMPAAPNMEVATDSAEVHRSRRLNIELLLAAGNHNCLTCEKNGDCKLQALAYEYGIHDIRFEGRTNDYQVEDSNPLIVRDFSRCILCGRCVQACNEQQVNRAIGYGYRGAASKIVTAGDRPYDQSDCVFCGQCVQVCPVGALTEKKARGLGRSYEMKKVRTTCPYCGVGCQQWLHVKDGKIVKVTAVEDGKPNLGMLCVKGRFGYDFIHSPERLTMPLLKKDGQQVPVSWDEALDFVADKLREIKAKHGADAIAGISCARSINEDSYNMQKLFRAVIGTNNIDHCARTCHAPTVAGLAMAFGSGAMTNSFADFEKAKLIFVIGSNTTEAHPVAGAYIKRAVLKGAELIVCDPRFNGIAEHAHLYVPIKVGSDVAFINGLMHVIIKEGLQDQAYIDNCTTGFAALKAKVAEYPPERAAAIAGISPEMLIATARRLARVKPAMLVYTLGITEHTCGVNNVLSTANLQMLLGNVGFECGGVNPLRGQNNVQGACDMGALPNVLPGYQKVTDPAVREKFQKAWGVEKLPDQVGLMIPGMFEGIEKGTIKGLWIFGENVANTEPDIRHVEHCLEKVDLLICNDIFNTETTRFADVVFPATAWSEDDGTFANSERRVSRVRKAVNPPGEARPNWWIFREVARRMGQEWASDSGQAIWDDEFSVLSPAFAGIKYHRIEGDGLQWPCPDEDHPGTACMHAGGQFSCGLGIFHALDWTPPAEVPDADYPLVLSTGRRLYHYHTRTQTGRCGGLNDLLGEETADISFADAAALGVADGDLVRVSSRRGQVVVRAKVTRQVPKGLVWMAFHFREGNANWLTNPAVDPISQTAEFKACAVRVERA